MICGRTRAAVLTFDDGWADNFKHALPVLKRHGVTATFFTTTQHLKDGVDDVRKMTRRELRDLTREGMTIGAHTRSHPDLTKLSDESRWDELAGCKADLEACVDTPVSFLAYPGGCLDRVTVEAAQKAGYVAACTSYGPGQNDLSTIHWLYRDVLTRNLRSPRDWYRLSRLARRALGYRVRRRVANQLAPAATRG
jgi:peptidoglycan/xylan/chitin deacetylase (PgdA/CDA1 family)